MTSNSPSNEEQTEKAQQPTAAEGSKPSEKASNTPGEKKRRPGLEEILKDMPDGTEVEFYDPDGKLIGKTTLRRKNW